MTDILDAQVLVLNRSWRPIHVTTVKRALTLVCIDNAWIVSPDTLMTYDIQSWTSAAQFASDSVKLIRTGRALFPAPEIITLRDYAGSKPRIVKFNRKNIFIRDRNCCQYCGRKVSSSELTLDHVVPRSRGGRASWDNIVVACMTCNVKKSNRTPAEANMRLIRLPIIPNWETINFHAKRDTAPASWEAFLGQLYWTTELDA
ncbi:MAG: HNH endonuclease [Planctomycetota bacterium]